MDDKGDHEILFCFVGSVIDIDECATNVHNCDSLVASCANSMGSFVCTCIQGYSGDGITCSGKKPLASSSSDSCHNILKKLFSVQFLCF